MPGLNQSMDSIVSLVHGLIFTPAVNIIEAVLKKSEQLISINEMSVPDTRVAAWSMIMK